MSAVPVAAAARDPGPIFTAAGVNTFTGRGWLAGEVDRFIASNPCGYVFVEAEAGLGKTAFAAWLVKTRGYLSHFSRYSGGRSVRMALQNLSAQLVREFRLDDQAPGGMLPEWAQTPGGFESVLGMASRRARERGLRLVLVVDGLDEAEPSDEGLAFGLPSLLPDGVYVVGTYRTGRWPGRPDSPAVTVLIRKDDLRNRRDIREFLTRAAGEEVLAARLAEASIDPADFVAVLAERCEGVWVYLRYVLQELRIGLRQPDAIGDLPSGLWNYYVAQIRHWQNDPAWDESLLPLLATLGVAGEPLPAVVLARLAGDWANAAPYYRCRFPSEFALANHVGHPLNVTLRQDILLDPLDEWLASKFGPQYLPGTIDELAAVITPPEVDPGAAEIDAQIAGCDRKLAQYRAALDAGAEPATVARWITETEAERARYQAVKRAAAPQLVPAAMSRDEIASVVNALSDALVVLRSADPADKAQIYAGLGLRLIYQPGERLVRTEVHVSPAQHWQFESVRGGIDPVSPRCSISYGADIVLRRTDGPYVL